MSLGRIDNLPQEPWFDAATGNPTQEFRDWIEEVVFGTSDNSINTVLSGQNGIIAGTTPLSDVLIDGRGSLVAEQDAQTDNINNTAASGGDLSAMADPSYAFNISGTGTVVSSSVTVTASGGTPSYSYAWTKVSGDDISVVSASSDTTTFQATGVTSGEIRTAVFRCTVTDSAGSPATTTVDVSVTLGDASGGIGAS